MEHEDLYPQDEIDKMIEELYADERDERLIEEYRNQIGDL